MNLRHGTVHDVEAIAQVKRPRSEESRSILEERQQERFAVVGEGRAVYLLVEHDREIVGHVFLLFDGTPSAPGYPVMEDLYVREDCRAQGFGGQLIAACERVAVERGFTRIGLAVNPILNARARGLYERLGYRDTGRPAYLDGVYDGVEEWVIDMAKRLAP